MRRLPRCSPDVALQYKQWTIPKGTPVGMGAYSLHTNFEVYPEPFKFLPERWLGDYDPRMNESWVPFSRGSRKCLGYKYEPIPLLEPTHWVLLFLLYYLADGLIVSL